MSKFHYGQTQTYLQLYNPEVSNPLRLKRVYCGDNLIIMALILFYIVWQFEWKRSVFLKYLFIMGTYVLRI